MGFFAKMPPKQHTFSWWSWIVWFDPQVGVEVTRPQLPVQVSPHVVHSASEDKLVVTYATGLPSSVTMDLLLSDCDDDWMKKMAPFLETWYWYIYNIYIYIHTGYIYAYICIKFNIYNSGAARSSGFGALSSNFRSMIMFYPLEATSKSKAELNSEYF